MKNSDPNGLRMLASTAIINGLDPRARATVIDLDSASRPLVTLTSNKSKLVAAANAIDSRGDVDLTVGIRAALTELAGRGGADRDRVLVVMSDGQGEFDPLVADEADAAGLRIFTVGLGSKINVARLTSIAQSTGGTYSQASPFVGPQPPAVKAPSTSPDSDEDGLSDCEEAQGAWDAVGIRHVTDPAKHDSDGDGLSDGQEVTNDLGSFGAPAAYSIMKLPIGIERFRYVISDPNDADSDNDGATDGLEFDAGTDPFATDTDTDKLSDFQETDRYGTDPLNRNSDGDNRDDGWEVKHAEAGFDPLIFDEETSKFRYAADFVAGATCPEGIGICEADSMAFLAGSIGGGFLGYKDVLDVIGNLTTLDFVGAGLAATAILPVAGDASSVAAKGVRFVRRVPARKQVDGLAYLARAKTVPLRVRTQIVRTTRGDEFRALKAQGMDDESIVTLVRNRQDLRNLRPALKSANIVRKSPRQYTLEKAAQIERANAIPGSVLERYFARLDCPSRCVVGSRKVDIYDAASRTATEIKVGATNATAHVRQEIAKDVLLLRDPNTAIDSVIWEFYPRQAGGVGPDPALLELLTSNGIPFHIYLP